MKARILFLAAVIISLFTACSSDSDGGLPITDANLIGKWYMKSWKVSNEAMQNYNHECPTSKDFQDFKSNHEVQYVAHNSDCEVGDSQTTIWSLEGNTLTLTYDDGITNPEVYKVASITESQLIIKRIFIDEDGSTENYFYYFAKN